MSNYPAGIRSYKTVVSMSCPKCEATWEAEATNDLGEIFIDDEKDEMCPECGEPGE